MSKPNPTISDETEPTPTLTPNPIPMRKTLSSGQLKDLAQIPIRKTLSSVPISDPEERLITRKLKSYSQPLSRLDLHQPSNLQNHRKQQHSFQFLNSSSYSHFAPTPLPLSDSPLPEFTGSGGGTGIFSLPRRAAVHPGRPPPIELRPHPLRETQTGCGIRSIISSSEGYLWAAQENGVRCWDMDRVFEGPVKGKGKAGDEESSPYWERKTGVAAATTCLVVDEGRGMVWTGHKDGRIRSWRVEKEEGGGDGNRDGDGNGDADGDGDSGNVRMSFKEGVSWNVHSRSVLSLVLTAYGNYYYYY